MHVMDNNILKKGLSKSKSAKEDTILGSYRVRSSWQRGKNIDVDWVRSGRGQDKQDLGAAEVDKQDTPHDLAPLNPPAGDLPGQGHVGGPNLGNDLRGGNRPSNGNGDSPPQLDVNLWKPLNAENGVKSQRYFGNKSEEIHSYKNQSAQNIESSDTGSIFGRSFPLFMPKSPDKQFVFKDDPQEYFKKFQGSFRCFLEGTDTAFMTWKDAIECKCRTDWHGAACSIPEHVFNSDYPHEYALLVRRGKSRRIVYGMPFLNEFDLLDAKVHMLYDVVDVFILLESNYTAAGKPNERRLLKKLKAGFLEEFQDKILYLKMDEFPRSAYTNGWIIDKLLRTRIGQAALSGLELSDDDLLIVTDVDEMPQKETLLFLKLHDGFTEPFGFVLRHNVFGFFWRGKGDDVTSNIFGGATVAYVKHVSGGDLNDVRGSSLALKDRKVIQEFERCCRGVIRPWLFGTWQLPAGWHCSWCLRPEDIVQKLQAAHVSDQPRWGNYPGKTDIDYIKNLIHTGTWFNDKYQFFESIRYEYAFAPKYVRSHPEQFEYLMAKP